MAPSAISEKLTPHVGVEDHVDLSKPLDEGPSGHSRRSSTTASSSSAIST
jgi:hypothetical protein